MIIDNTYFVARNESLPVDELGSILTAYINRYEPKILSKLLGYSLYKDFEAGFNAATPEQKWLDLANGSDYTYNGILKRFDGLKEVSVNYVYYKYSKENQGNNTSIGIKTTLSENSEETDPSYKQLYSLNYIADINCQLIEFINAKNEELADTYPNYIQGVFEKMTRFNF
jgi:hypothetical protein